LTTPQLLAVAEDIMDGRFAMDPHDPRCQMAAIAVVGLRRVQSRSLGKRLEESGSLSRIRRVVTDDVERAAELIDAGLRTIEHVDRKREDSDRIKG
jgi:hypothetical protein